MVIFRFAALLLATHVLAELPRTGHAGNTKGKSIDSLQYEFFAGAYKTGSSCQSEGAPLTSLQASWAIPSITPPPGNNGQPGRWWIYLTLQVGGDPSCSFSGFSAGIAMNIAVNDTGYSSTEAYAYYETGSDPLQYFDDIDVAVGDGVTVTINMGPSVTTYSIEVEGGNQASASVDTQDYTCNTVGFLQVVNPVSSSGPSPLASFEELTIDLAQFHFGNKVVCGLPGATVFNMVQNGMTIVTAFLDSTGEYLYFIGPQSQKSSLHS